MSRDSILNDPELGPQIAAAVTEFGETAIGEAMIRHRAQVLIPLAWLADEEHGDMDVTVVDLGFAIAINNNDFHGAGEDE
jgi:hypothetical protein